MTSGKVSRCGGHRLGFFRFCFGAVEDFGEGRVFWKGEEPIVARYFFYLRKNKLLEEEQLFSFFDEPLRNKNI